MTRPLRGPAVRCAVNPFEHTILATFRIAPRLLDALGWNERTRVRPRFGEGEAGEVLRLLPSLDGGLQIHHWHGRRMLRVALKRILRRDLYTLAVHPSVAVPWAIELSSPPPAATLLVRLPDIWLRNPPADPRPLAA